MASRDDKKGTRKDCEYDYYYSVLFQSKRGLGALLNSSNCSAVGFQHCLSWHFRASTNQRNMFASGHRGLQSGLRCISAGKQRCSQARQSSK
jgi:hypothetical protein